MPEQESLPEELEDILESLEGPILIQWIQSGLFVCVFRYLTEVLEDHMGYSEVTFWKQALQVVRNYQVRFPELAERFEAFDLMRPVFPKLCLNRVRLLDQVTPMMPNAQQQRSAVCCRIRWLFYPPMLKLRNKKK